MVKRVGNYEMGRTLGHGTFSKVKLAVDVTDRTRWAVKVICRKEVVKEHMEGQLRREIGIMKMLKHPNIVSLREVLQTQRNIYIVLELVTGGELFDRIVQAKRFDEDTARLYFQQLMLGVEFCHQHGIAHRDLKPENLLLAGDTLKISDFGLSTLQETRNQLMTTTCGTPNYVAPEVLAEKGYEGMKADIWSCGVILFVMLAGFLPFDDPSLTGLFDKIEKGDFKMPKFFTAEAADLISKMLVVNPLKRVSIARIKSHPWFKRGFREVEMRTVEGLDKIDGASAISAVADEMEVEGFSETPPLAMNAFEIASRLMAGSLLPLISKEDVPRRLHTTFLATGVPGVVKDRLMEELRKLNVTYRTKETSLEVKGAFPGPHGPVTFSTDIVPTVSDGLCMVEIRRGKGDTLDFSEMYRRVYDAVRDILATTSTVEAEQERMKGKRRGAGRA